jgi:dinuclear metal center YbgI/SA1388 family protein
MQPIQRDDLETYLAAYLETARFRDYCPNGLQVEGRRLIAHVVTGVTASLALIERSLDLAADAVIVHHGYFWRGEDARVVGPRRTRLAKLLAHDLNLFAYHLPLDVHPEVGNNAQLAVRLGLLPEGRFGEQNVGAFGVLAQPASLAAFAAQVESALGRKPLTIGAPEHPIRRIAWCTGAAQGMIDEAAALGVDAYLTGEASEQTVHYAREAGIAFIAAGHHATERSGVQALGQHLAAHFGLRHSFVDIDNPV